MDTKKGSFSGEKKAYPVAASDYMIMEEIGRGVSAVVYRSKCIPLDEFVAIKSLDLERCNSSLDDIRREAQTMSLINHPNVVKAYCSFVVDRSLWVVMPYMAGGSCLHIMKAAYPDGFEEPVIATFLKETLKALEYLHHHGHIHRDVKAGNILVDGKGSVKLGDFGVSACLFDNGDRQRARNTFVGTPCWMAPEVMEQLHGYDFKADIWSFGITALELAHGHAPFSKYPPMKVLLMTLQNAPPGLDYERDRRFSKSFKEMIAMCLVKDPAKRPSAEKLLKHSFFKHARLPDYVARVILDPLPPLWERVHDLKMKDAARLAEKKMPYVEQEERSQNEYKRGMSGWNFDLEDLKAQACLIDDIATGKEEFSSKDCDRKDVDAMESSSTMPSPPILAQENEPFQQLVTIHSLKAESTTDAGEHVTRVCSGPLPSLIPSTKSSPDAKHVQPSGSKKEPKHIGRFDVFEDDPDQDNPDSPDDIANIQQKPREEKDLSSEDNVSKHMDGRETAVHATGTDKFEHDSSHRGHSLGLMSADASHADENSRDVRNATVYETSMPQLQKERSFSVSPAVIENEDHCSNGPVDMSRPAEALEIKNQKDSVEEKMKAPIIQKKGRFSVTSHDTNLQEDISAASADKNACVQTSTLRRSGTVGDFIPEHAAVVPTSTPLQASSLLPSTFNVSLVMPELQNLLHQTTIQQDLIVNLMNTINPSEQYASNHPGGVGNKALSLGQSMSSTYPMGGPSVMRERELLAQIAELQCRVVTLVDELQAVKLRNIQLERQLNAIFNKEEEERIRREEAAIDDG